MKSFPHRQKLYPQCNVEKYLIRKDSKDEDKLQLWKRYGKNCGKSFPQKK